MTSCKVKCWLKIEAVKVGLMSSEQSEEIVGVQALIVIRDFSTTRKTYFTFKFQNRFGMRCEVFNAIKL